MSYEVTKARMYQWVGILLLLAVFAGAYWYFSVRAGVKSNTASSQPQGVGRLDSGLAGYWPLDDASGTSATDSSTNGNTGTLTNGPTWTTGQIGGAVNFDGTDDYIIKTPLSLFTDRFTVSIWAKMSASVGEDYIFDYRNGNSLVAFRSASGQNDIFVRDASGNVPGGGQVSPGFLYDDAWHMYTITADGANVRAFRDGVQQGAASTWTNSISTGSTMTLGEYSGGGNYFQGSLDEIRAYNRSLSADEVAQLYRLTAPTGVDTSLKGYWSFDGQDISGTTAYDRSGAGNNGTLTNGPVITEGIVGQALSFDGSNDDVRVTDATSLDITGTVTLSAWIKKTSHPLSGNFQNILDKGTSASSQVNYALKTYGSGSSEQVVFYFINSGVHSIRGNTNLDLNQWYLLTAVYDDTANSIKLYVNGVLQANTVDYGSPETTSLLTNNQSIYMGSQGGAGQYFPGNIDEMRVYNRALPASEIQSLYASGSPDKTNSARSQPQGGGRLDSSLAGYWKLDDGSGASAADSSTNGNTGTLTNSPAWATGQIGGALTFDHVSTKYVSVPDSPAISPSKQMSVALWTQRTDVIGLNNRMYVGKSESGQRSWGLVSMSTGAVRFYVSTTSADVGTYVDTTTTPITQNSWAHVVAVFDGAETGNTNRARIYVNGTLQPMTATGTIPAALVDTTANLLVGYGGNGNLGTAFTGNLDEVRVYDRSLSADEISQLYRLATPTAVDTGLKGYWSFNGKDISGTTAFDRSGNGKSGTIAGTPAVMQGIAGQGMYFDGVDDAITTAQTIPSIGSFSVWLKPDFSLSPSANYKIINTTENGGNFDFGFNTYANYDSWILNLRGAFGATVEITDDDYTSDDQITGWHHVVATWSTASGAQLYLDGVLVASTATTTGSFTAMPFAFSASWKGGVDEARLYNRVLTAVEVKSLYDVVTPDKTNSASSQPQGTGRLDSGLAGYWKLDDGSGTSATDSSTNGGNATLTGTPTWVTGQIGGGLDFDGVDDKGTVTYSASLVATSTLSYAFWIKPDLNDGIGFLGALNGEDGSAYNFIKIDNSGAEAGNPKIRVTRRISGATATREVQFTYPVSTWFHCVYTYDGVYESLYINGNKLGEWAQTGSFATNTEYGLILGRETSTV